MRSACGNGLAADVWEAFQARFAIPRILEFYAATEGNFSLYNVEGKPGAIGRLPPFLAHRFPAAIVRFDAEAGAPVRGDDGRCIRCERGEAGEAIGRVSLRGAGRFEGYTDAAATETKLLRDVFEPGDAWVRTGDLMCTDDQGFWWFVDRVGDTFRWKGENVATAEVAAAIRSFPGVADACVYGVEVPRRLRQGRHGGDRGDTRLRPRGPARPPRRRACRTTPARSSCGWFPALEVTETFKQKKQSLAAEGWDPTRIADPLYVEDRATRAYVALDDAVAARIRGGELRL